MLDSFCFLLCFSSKHLCLNSVFRLSRLNEVTLWAWSQASPWSRHLKVSQQRCFFFSSKLYNSSQWSVNTILRYSAGLQLFLNQNSDATHGPNLTPAHRFTSQDLQAIQKISEMIDRRIFIFIQISLSAAFIHFFVRYYIFSFLQRRYHPFHLWYPPLRQFLKNWSFFKNFNTLINNILFALKFLCFALLCFCANHLFYLGWEAKASRTLRVFCSPGTSEFF